MQRKYNVTGADRKELVGIIGNTVGMKPVYKFMPTCAYVISNITVEKDGTMVWDERTDEDTIKKVTDALAAAGFACEPQDGEEETAVEVSEEPQNAPQSENVGLTVEIPLDKVAVGNLTKIIDSKAALIRKALGTEDLRIEVKEDKVAFPWFSEVDADHAAAYTRFIAALCEMSRNAKRVTAKEKEVENEKYAFRCFLLRLGFIGAEYKKDRRILLENLTGSSAFRNGGADHEISE